MKPGLSRAVPAAILGFLASMGIVMLIRWLQEVEPIFDAEIGMILGAFVATFAFVWGAGGTNPSMSEHAHEPEVDEETGLVLAEETEEEAEEEASEETVQPTTILGYSMWQVAFYTTLLFTLLFGFATQTIIDLFLQTSNEASASAGAVGYFTYQPPFGLPEVQMSQLTLFVLFVIFTLVSLAVIGGAIGLVFLSLSRNLQEVRTEEEGETRFTYELAAPAHLRKPFVGDLFKALAVIGLYVIMYDFMERGAMGFTQATTWLLIGLAVVLGVVLTGMRTRNMAGVDATIEAVKVNSMTAALIFLFPVMYLIHYEALVGFIFGPPILRVPLSLGGAVVVSGALTFVLFNATVSSIVVGGARWLVANLRDEEEIDQDEGEPAAADTNAIQNAEVTES